MFFRRADKLFFHAHFSQDQLKIKIEIGGKGFQDKESKESLVAIFLKINLCTVYNTLSVDSVDKFLLFFLLSYF